MQCISCGSRVDVIKQWSYNDYYQVQLCQCLDCKFTFKAYFHNGTFSHTIPKYTGPAKKVLNFLKTHEDFASTEEIAKILKLKRKDVEAVLIKFEEDGIAQRQSKI